ncbi:MAG: hypothetical protein DRP72_00330 [Candidatus Omnitrophota bacterium]|nr:MAG: hypothetical protein DRP72_00330 [Candidatus Omnitrophota bacterium]
MIKLARRDIKDAKLKGLSLDRKFACAYNAVLQLATILLYCKGYKPKGIGHHITVFEAMKEILGKDYYELADYFDSCRAKRNITDYDYAGGISEQETEELIKEAESLLKTIFRWLEMNYSDFI